MSSPSGSHKMIIMILAVACLALTAWFIIGAVTSGSKPVRADKQTSEAALQDDSRQENLPQEDVDEESVTSVADTSR